jgi:hypothetical protein
MKFFWLSFLVSVVILSSYVSADSLDDCSVLRYAGQIIRIDPQDGEVFVFRDNKKFIGHIKTCLFKEDKVKAGYNVAVDILADEGTIRIGRNQATYEWDAPPFSKNPEVGHWDNIEEWFTSSRSSNREPVLSIGQGIENVSCPDSVHSPGRSIAPLVLLPAIPQKVGADLHRLVVAWQYESGCGDVTVRLIHNNSDIFPPRRICQQSQIFIDVPEEVRQTGNLLVIQARDAHGDKLEWKVEILAPEALPHPETKISTPWLLAAWRLVERGDEYKLDAVSRLLEASKHSCVAKWFLSAVLSNQKINRR